MKSHSIIILFLVFTTNVVSQNIFKAVVKEKKTQQPIIGINVIIKGTTVGAASNWEGLIEIKNVPDGNHEFIFHLSDTKYILSNSSFL